jgi:hypothetical protein
MSNVASVKDIHAVLVESATDNTDIGDKVVESARAFDFKAMAEDATSGTDLVNSIKRAALLASAEHLGSQITAVQKQVKAEAGALKRQDVTKVPAILHKHIAEERARRAEAVKKDG